MPPPAATPFKTPARFRAWLARNHARETELVVRLFKVHASQHGIGYREALEEALCFGWIDGVRRSIDEDSFSVRFTPRKPKSIWSNINVRIVERLQSEGRMKPPGLAAFERRDEKRTGIYAFESKSQGLSPGFEKRLRAVPKAWKHFESQPPWYRRTAAHWVMNAKREETRERRLGILIEHSAKGKPLPQLDRTPR